MTLLYPAALVGLLAAAMPIAIYLFLRRRKTEINWGAGYLLRLTLASRKKSSLWRQFVLLAIRSLILALAAFLIAQPFMPGQHPSLDTPALPAKPVHRIILFDNSRSMTVSEDKITRIDRARSAAATLLHSQRSGDMLDLIPLIPEAGNSLEPITLDGIIDDNKAEHTLASLPIRDGLLNLEPALASAMTRLATTPNSASEIYLFSDFPRELENQIDGIQWFGQLITRENGEPIKIRVAPVNMVGPATEEAQQNVSVDAITMGTDLIVAGIPTRLYVDASNHSDRETVAIFDVTIAPSTSGAQATALRQLSVRLNPDEHKRIAIPLVLPAGNGQVLSIAVRPSRLTAQGTRMLSVDVKDTLNVWLIPDEKDPSSQASGNSEPDDTEFFTRALKQRKDSGAGITLKIAKTNDLTVAIPPEVDAIILAAPHYTTPAIAKPLTDFVRRGGGLLLTVGPTIQIPAFNENAAPLLPALFDQPMHEKVDPETFLQAQIELGTPGATGPNANPLRPLFEEFAGQGTATVASDLTQARFYNHLRLKDPQNITGVVLRLSNADPLLIEKRIGRGHIFLFTSTLGIGWTSLPVRQSYIPLITRTLTASVAGRTLPLNLEPGQTFVAAWPAQPGKPGPTLTLPDQTTKSLSVLDAAVGEFVVIDGLHDAGVYRLTDAEGHKKAFTLIGGAAEADLRSLAENPKAKLGQSLGAPVYADWTTAVATLGAEGQTSPLWPWLLAVMLLLYLFETWFVRTL